MQRATVDLPEPDSPTMPRISPLRSVRLTSAAATTPCAARENSEPPPPGAAQALTCSTGWPAGASRRDGTRLGTEDTSRRVWDCLGSARISWRVPLSTRSPRFITMMRSEISATTPKSWVMNSTAVLCLTCSSLMSARICFCVVTSSAVVGSSAISRRGSRISAMAMTMRWRWPPESWCG